MQENDGQRSGASPVTLVTVVTGADGVTFPTRSPPPPPGRLPLVTSGDAPPMIRGDISLMLKGGVSPIMEGDASPMSEDDASPAVEGDVSLMMEGRMSASEAEQTSDAGLTLVAPQLTRARSAPNQSTSRLAVRSPDVNFRRSDCRSAEDMMMGTRQQCGGDLNDYFSTMDPSQFHFYDFGIQDFLVMKSHQNVDMSHEDEEVQHGDYNLGMNVSPRPYLSDSDLSVTSIELSPAQVLWEKKLLDDTSILRNCLLKRSRRQAVAAQESGRGRLQGLRRRATELCIGHQRAKNVGRKMLSRPLSVTEMGVTEENCLRSKQSSLDVGDDCTTIAWPPMDIEDDCTATHRSSADISDNSNGNDSITNGHGAPRDHPETELAS